MFGEDLMMGKSIGKIDKKHRIFIPSFTKVKEEDELAIICSKDNYIKLYLLQEYLKIAKRFQELQKNACSIEEYKKYEQEIAKICTMVDSVIKVDIKNRILIPQIIMDKLDWNNKEIVTFEGNGNYLKIS